MSPDGLWVLATVNNQLYLLTVPRVGGEAPTVNVNSASVPLKKLTDVGVDSFAWADGGATITWNLGSSFFRLKLADVGFEPEKRPAPAEIEVAVEQPRHRPSGSIVLRGARVITMRGDEVIAGADIVVTDNRIAAVGRRGSVAIPSGARTQDLAGSTIMPGIIDVHAHWSGRRGGLLETQEPSFLANLAYGVTTGRDPQTGTNTMFAYQDLVDAGEMLGPRAFSTGPGVFADSDFQSLDDARKTVARYKKHYRTNTLKSYLVGNRKQRQWMVEACREHQIMPTTEGGLDLELDLTHAIDGFSGNEHSLPIVPLYKDVVELYARSGIFYTPTLLVAYGGPFGENYFFETTEVHNDAKLRRFFPHSQLDSRTQRRQWFRPDEHIFSRIAAGAAQIVRAGGRVSVGGHGQLQGLQCHWEMWALHSGGMTNMEVLRAATLHGAEAIGFGQDLGSIEAGKLADLIVLTKDPLQDIRNTNTIRYVMKNGELFEGDTLDQVWPRQKKLEPMWWWTEDPAR
jgi:imidazolonepropionase-like amidohydrolase